MSPVGVLRNMTRGLVELVSTWCTYSQGSRVAQSSIGSTAASVSPRSGMLWLSVSVDAIVTPGRVPGIDDLRGALGTVCGIWERCGVVGMGMGMGVVVGVSVKGSRVDVTSDDLRCGHDGAAALG